MVSGDEGPQKSWRNKIRVRVRALTIMDLESHVQLLVLSDIFIYLIFRGNSMDVASY